MKNGTWIDRAVRCMDEKTAEFAKTQAGMALIGRMLSQRIPPRVAAEMMKDHRKKAQAVVQDAIRRKGLG